MIDADFWDDILEELEEDTEKDLELETRVWCGCGNHMIDATKDPYKEHNRWVEGDNAGHIEKSPSSIHNVKGIGVSSPKQTHSYDFSGEEFEVDNETMRKLKK